MHYFYVNVDVENAVHSDLVICNNFINYKLLPAFNFDFIYLDSFQLLQTDIIHMKKIPNDYCFSLALFIFPIIFARVFLRGKHKTVKTFFVCIIFQLSITKPNLLTKNDILKLTCKIFTYESIDACSLLLTSHLHNVWHFFRYQNLSAELKTLLNCYCDFRVISV